MVARNFSPKCLINIESFQGNDDYDFLNHCYSKEGNFSKQQISEKEREKLVTILREHSYLEFIKDAEKNVLLDPPE